MLKHNAIKLLAVALMSSACVPIVSPSDAPKQVRVHVTAQNYMVRLDQRGRSMSKGAKQQLDDYLTHVGDLQAIEFSIRRTHKRMALRSLIPVEKELIARGADPSKVYRLAEIGIDYTGNANVVEVIAKRYVAVAPDCPDVSRPDDPLGNQNITSSNFGCATASALAMSIADPRDLVRGRDTGPGNGAHSAASVDRYQTDQVKALQDVSTQESTSSQ